ncbi:MAG: LytTR family DNA-binding domain-containing protein, partial [Bacteroidota bacterium]|nr:LytTR family DNA-binding domain-containing protein [Bacteroidota bacterium]
SIGNIQLIETCGDYVTIFCTDKKLVVHGTLKSWEEKLKGSSFMKVHRTTIVNLSKIDHIEGNQIQIGVHKLPVSEQFKEQLLERIFGKNEKDPNYYIPKKGKRIPSFLNYFCMSHNMFLLYTEQQTDNNNRHKLE